MNPDSHDLIQRHMAGLLTEDEAAALQTRLKADTDLRRLYLHYMNLDVALEAQAGSRDRVIDLLRAAPLKENKPAVRWLSWRSLAAAAAGIVFGILCTSVVFAYVAPALGKVVTLLDESFESGPAPLVTGVPVEVGRWSGDYSEIGGEQQGVKPASGKKMLRFLRADYEGKPSSEPSAIADIYRLVDVRSYRREFADGCAVVQFSAAFNAFSFPEGEAYECKMGVQAFDAQTATDGSLRMGNTRIDRELAGASTGRIKLDRNPATWQRMTGDLRLPPETDFLLIHIVIQRPHNLPPSPTFAGHYLDDVRLTLRRSPLN